MVSGTEREQRERVIAAARAWEGTPYHHRAMLKGLGADCATLLVACFREAGLFDAQELPQYSPQWHLNQNEEAYLAAISEWCGEIAGPPQPGDLVMWRFGRTLSHAAIVLQWPTVIHALWGVGVIRDDAERSQRLASIGRGELGAGGQRERRFYSYWAARSREGGAP